MAPYPILSTVRPRLCEFRNDARPCERGEARTRRSVQNDAGLIHELARDPLTLSVATMEIAFIAWTIGRATWEWRARGPMRPQPHLVELRGQTPWRDAACNRIESQPTEQQLRKPAWETRRGTEFRRAQGRLVEVTQAPVQRRGLDFGDPLLLLR